MKSGEKNNDLNGKQHILKYNRKILKVSCKAKMANTFSKSIYLQLKVQPKEIYEILA